MAHDGEGAAARAHGDHDPAAVLGAVQGHLAAFNARDVDGIIAGFAEDAVFAAGEDLVVGVRSLRAFFADAFAGPARARLALRRAVVSGDTAACELAEAIELPQGGAALDLAVFFTVRDGRLVRVRVYRDVG